MFNEIHEASVSDEIRDVCLASAYSLDSMTGCGSSSLHGWAGSMSHWISIVGQLYLQYMGYCT